MGGPGSGYWDRIGDEWARERPQLLWRRHSDAVNRELLSRWLPTERSERLLKTDTFDEAVGDGLTDLLCERAREIHGIDISGAVLRGACRRSARMLPTAADCRALPFADQSFDVVVSISTLDHFATRDEIRTSLAEIRRVMRTGATLLLTLDNPGNPVIALRSMLPDSWLRTSGLVPYYVGATLGSDDLVEALRSSGFQVEELTAVLHAPRVAAVAVARLLDRFGSDALRERFVRLLERFEAMRRWPSRFRTGHFLAVRATAFP